MTDADKPVILMRTSSEGIQLQHSNLLEHTRNVLPCLGRVGLSILVVARAPTSGTLPCVIPQVLVRIKVLRPRILESASKERSVLVGWPGTLCETFTSWMLPRLSPESTISLGTKLAPITRGCCSELTHTSHLPGKSFQGYVPLLGRRESLREIFRFGRKCLCLALCFCRERGSVLILPSTNVSEDTQMTCLGPAKEGLLQTGPQLLV